MNKEKSFIAVIQQNSGLIYKAASLYTSQKEDREDLVQEIIYQLWKSFDSFEKRSSMSTWIYRVAMNVAIFHLKKSKKRIAKVPIDQSLVNLSSDSTGEADSVWETVKLQIQHLTILEKGILMLYLEEKSYQEIAQIIGISESNVGTKLSRIKAKLKNRVQKIDDNGIR